MSTTEIKEQLKGLILTIAQIRKMHAMLMSENLAPVGITFDQWVVLVIVDQQGPLPAKSVAELSGKDSSTITRVLDQLEKKELIAREKSKKDRRSIIIRITESSKKITKLIRPLEEEIFKKSITNISTANLTNAAHVFDTILINQRKIATETERIS